MGRPRQAQQQHQPTPKHQGFSRKQRIRATVLIAFLAAVAIGTAWVLSSALLIPGIWAIISIAIVGVLATLFAFYALIPLLFPPDSHPPSPPPLFPHPTSSPASPPAEPKPLWTVPYRRNALFTGREQLLIHLHDNLIKNKAAALTQAQAISGLGGIGKTQVAIEYAYRHREEYDAVLWFNAATHETLLADSMALAGLLQLPESNEQNQTITVAAVKRWLIHQESCLLIFDNADELAIVEDVLPPGGNSHILLTTRAQAVGTLANSLEVEQMDQQEALFFLLRRAKVLARDTPLEHAPQRDQTAAQAIIEEMDGLPLALDQAGAYVDESGCTLSDYLRLYRARRKDLLQRPSQFPTYHPDPIATTWSLSFQKVERANPAAADLLQVCAFLAPDAIPEEFFRKGAEHLGPVLAPVVSDPWKQNEAITLLRQYSLLRRHVETHTLSMHRLVQAVLKDNLDQRTRHQWEKRVIRALNQALPKVEPGNLLVYEPYLPHVEMTALLMEQEELSLTEGANVLHSMGRYLYYRARYAQAEPLYQRALRIKEKALGPEHPSTANTLHELARLSQAQGDYAQAEPLYQRALRISEKALGPEHPSTASTLHELARLYQDQGDYAQAEPLYQRALRISEKALGPEHPSTGTTLHELASLYQNQGDYAQAEPLYQRALAIFEQRLGARHPHTIIAQRSYTHLLRNMREEDASEQE